MDIRTNANQAGSFYDAGVLRWGALLIVVLLSLNLASFSEDFDGVPDPAPTDAVKASGETFTSTGSAAANQDLEAARFAALLDAYQNLVVDGLRRGVLAGGWGEMEGSFRLFQVDQDHPNPQMMAWLTRSKVVEEKDKEGRRLVVIESPETGDLAAVQPAMRAVVTQDVDQDGLSDVVSVGYDGSVYISKTLGGESQVVAKSPSYAYFEVVSGPGLQRVRAVLPTSVGSIEPAGVGQARCVLELESLEMVNGRLLGKGTEQREVLVSLTETDENIRFTLEDPPDFTRLYQGEVELRGKALAMRSLDSLEIRHNGELTWESPQGLNLSALQFNLARPLNGGWNLFRLTARDQEGALQRRDLWLHGPPSQPARGFEKKRAVVVTLDDGLREKKLIGSLQKAGYSSDNITLLAAGGAEPEDLLEEIRDGGDCQDLLLYIEAMALPGMLIDGKVLKLGDGTVSSSDLAQAINAGGYQRVLAVLYTELDGSLASRPSDDLLWQDTSRFLERLGDGGRLALANVESSRDSARSKRSRSRDRLLQALDAQSGSDLSRLVDLEQPSNTLFRGWMFGPPVLGGGDPPGPDSRN
jgi:hypothetical protein